MPSDRFVLCCLGNSSFAEASAVCAEFSLAARNVESSFQLVESLQSTADRLPIALVVALGSSPATTIFDQADGSSAALQAASRCSVPVIVYSHTACRSPGVHAHCTSSGVSAVICDPTALRTALAGLNTSVHPTLSGELPFNVAAQHGSSEWTINHYPSIARRRAFADDIAALSAPTAPTAVRASNEDDDPDDAELDRKHYLKLYNAVERQTEKFSSTIEPILSSLLLPPATYSSQPHSIVRFVVVSDTHNHHRHLKLPAGEVLIHCGDLVGNYGYSGANLAAEALDVAKWLSSQPFRRVFVIGGNHDTVLDMQNYPQHAQARAAFLSALAPHVTYLENDGAVYRGLQLWGSPLLTSRAETEGNRYYSDGFETHSSVREAAWKSIPEQLDVLITHTPAHGNSADVVLAQRLDAMDYPPLVHCCGHAHKECGVSSHPHGNATWFERFVRDNPEFEVKRHPDARFHQQRICINAAQEKMLQNELKSGGTAWVFDMQARD